MGANTDATVRLQDSTDITIVPILPSRNIVNTPPAYHDTLHEKVCLLVFAYYCTSIYHIN